MRSGGPRGREDTIRYGDVGEELACVEDNATRTMIAARKGRGSTRLRGSYRGYSEVDGLNWTVGAARQVHPYGQYIGGFVVELEPLFTVGRRGF